MLGAFLQPHFDLDDGGGGMSAYWVAVRIEDGFCGSEPFDSTEAVARFVMGRLNEGAVVEADVWTVKKYEEEPR